MVNSPDTIKAVSLCVSYADIISVTHFCPDLSCPVSWFGRPCGPTCPWQGASSPLGLPGLSPSLFHVMVPLFQSGWLPPATPLCF